MAAAEWDRHPVSSKIGLTRRDAGSHAAALFIPLSPDQSNAGRHGITNGPQEKIAMSLSLPFMRLLMVSRAGTGWKVLPWLAWP